MHNFVSYLLSLAVAACALGQESSPEDLHSGYVCLIDDPNPNRCDNFCLTELRPLLNQVDRGQDRGNTCDADIANKVQGQLHSLADQQTKLEGQLQGVEAKLESQQAVLNQLKAILIRIKNQLQPMPSNIETPQEDAKMVTSVLKRKSIPSDFELIGTRYFKLVKRRVTWETAKKNCGKLGGHLASFQNKEEIAAIAKKVQIAPIWLGINDRNTEGHFVSEASLKPAQTFQWSEGQPSDKNHTQNCVLLQKGEMMDFQCDTHWYYICQADNET